MQLENWQIIQWAGHIHRSHPCCTYRFGKYQLAQKNLVAIGDTVIWLNWLPMAWWTTP